MECQWCGAEVDRNDVRCPVCKASIVNVSLPEKTEKEKDKELSLKSKRHIKREDDFDFTVTGNLAIGVDPGGRHTAICVVDNDRLYLLAVTGELMMTLLHNGRWNVLIWC